VRTEAEIIDRFQKQYRRRRAERIAKYTRRTFRNCVHNQRVKLRGKRPTGFCTCSAVLEKEGASRIVPCTGDDKALHCAHYKCKHTRESVVEDFLKVLGDPAKCGREYPKIAVMLWVLQNVNLEETEAGKPEKQPDNGSE